MPRLPALCMRIPACPPERARQLTLSLSPGLVICLAALAFSASASPLEARTPSQQAAASERLGVRDAGELRRQRKALHRSLVAAQAVDALHGAVRIDAESGETAAQLENREGGGGPGKPVGISRAAKARVDLAGLSGLDGEIRLRFGAVRRSEDELVWSGAVRSEGAYGLRVRFTNLALPRGAELYVYNEQGAAAGPYTGRGPNGDGELWSHTVPGETAFIQLRQPVGRPAASFRIAGVAHMSRELSGISTTSGSCGDGAGCMEDAACTSSPAVADAEDGVALILFQSGRFWFICSGALLADTDPATAIPYFLTADFCIDSSEEAASVETYFFYRSPECGAPCPDLPASPSTVGATLLSTGSDGAYTLLELAEPPPPGAVRMGWSTTPVAHDHGTTLYRIGHTEGGPQTYSEQVVDANQPLCAEQPGDWIYSRDTLGATDDTGSAGAPAVNAAGQVVGHLVWRCGTNLDDECDSTNNANVDGAFAAYFPHLAPFLDPPICFPLTLTHQGAGTDPSPTPARSSGCAPGEFIAGEVIALEASPDAGWLVAGWSGSEDDGSTAATNTVTMPALAHETAVVYEFPDERILDGETLEGVEAREACLTVRAGDVAGFGTPGDTTTIAASAEVTLRAGHQVIFHDGFVVEPGANLTVDIALPTACVE